MNRTKQNYSESPKAILHKNLPNNFEDEICGQTDLQILTYAFSFHKIYAHKIYIQTY